VTAKCANPACDHAFHYFRNGKIYLIDMASSGGAFRSSIGSSGTEYFWLCGDCSQNMRVTLDGHGAAKVERLAEPMTERQETASTTRELAEKPLRPATAT
jgi:hypothetical protein